MTRSDHWAQIGEVGFIAGMRFLFLAYRLGGRVLFQIVLQPVLLYYFLSHGVARRASKDYLQRLRDYWPEDANLPEASVWNSYRHFNAFALSALDRLGVWADADLLDTLEFPSRPTLLAQLASGRGAVLLGAHLGNLEICRGLSTRNPDLRLNILVHTRHADKFNRLLREVVQENAITLIEVSELSPATAIQLQECIERGEFIAILADRVPLAGGDRTTTLPFLGAEAAFPDGPFILASLLKCPVYALFSGRKGTGYEVHCRKLTDAVRLPRGKRSLALRQYMQDYVHVLEENVRRYPLQWFNFYPFWKQDKKL